MPTPELNRMGALQHQRDWALHPLALRKLPRQWRGYRCSQSSSYLLLRLSVPGTTEHGQAGMTNRILQTKDKNEAQRLQSFVPGCTASK